MPRNAALLSPATDKDRKNSKNHRPQKDEDGGKKQ